MVSVRQAHSRQMQLLETIHQLARTLNSGASSHIIFLDFAKRLGPVSKTAPKT